MALSPEKRDAAVAAAAAMPDPQLHELLRVLREYDGLVAIGVVAGGATITGLLGLNWEEVPEALDEQLQWLISEVAKETDDEARKAYLEQHAADFESPGVLAQRTRAFEEEHARIEADVSRAAGEQGAESFYDLPDDLGRSYIDADFPIAFTLSNARVLVAGSAPLEVGAVRVRVDQIAAWWPESLQDDPASESTSQGDDESNAT